MITLSYGFQKKSGNKWIDTCSFSHDFKTVKAIFKYSKEHTSVYDYRLVKRVTQVEDFVIETVKKTICKS